MVSLVSSPGSGKTAFLEKTLTLLRPRYRVAALVGDLATDNDADAPGPQPGAGQADHHRNGLPSGSRHGPSRTGEIGISPSSIFCSSKMSATWSALRPTTLARNCGWCCYR